MYTALQVWCLLLRYRLFVVRNFTEYAVMLCAYIMLDSNCCFTNNNNNNTTMISMAP